MNRIDSGGDGAHPQLHLRHRHEPVVIEGNVVLMPELPSPKRRFRSTSRTTSMAIPTAESPRRTKPVEHGDRKWRSERLFRLYLIVTFTLSPALILLAWTIPWFLAWGKP
jgi:hypothetical protein